MTLLTAEQLRTSHSETAGQLPVSLAVASGQTVWIAGHSGAGKTTLLLSLARLNPTLSGEVHLKGIPWTNYSPAEWRSRVAYVHQKAVMFRGTVDENLRRVFGLRNRRDRAFDPMRTERLLDTLGIPGSLMSREAATLSVGEAARIALVRTLITNPQVLLLDEPTASLDAGSREAVQDVLADWLSQDERAIIAVSHDENFRSSLPGLVVELNSGVCRS